MCECNIWTEKYLNWCRQTHLFVILNIISEATGYCPQINTWCAVFMSMFDIPLIKFSIKSRFEKKQNRMKCWFVYSFHLMGFLSSISKSGSMEAHLALSAVLAGREYLTSQIALLFFFFCFLGSRLLSVAMQPHPPNCQVQGHIPLLFRPLSQKKLQKRKVLCTLTEACTLRRHPQDSSFK